jgi:enoyl-CoA hydratase
VRRLLQLSRPYAQEGIMVLKVERSGSVLVLELNRPRQRNAIDAELTRGLDAALELLDRDRDLAAAVLTGGREVFSAGTDLHEEASPSTPAGGEYGIARRARRKPVVAAVEGLALGGGFEIVLACDLVVAAESSQFGLPEVKRGVVANCGAFFRAPQRLSPTIALEMLLTGESVSARRAYEAGLVNAVVADGTALEFALALAAKIVRNSPSAVAATLAGVREARADLERTGWAATERAARDAGASPDRAEGISAFFEKREPRWSCS